MGKNDFIIASNLLHLKGKTQLLILMRLVFLRSFALLVVVSSVVLKVSAQEKEIPLKKIPANGAKPYTKDTIIIDKGVPQKDIADVLRHLFHSKPVPEIDSVTSKAQISIVPAIGYTLVSRFAIVLSGNVAWRGSPQARVSTVTASSDYTQNKQFTIPVQTSIWTNNNDFNFTGDYRFYKYPQNTYGLGSNGNIKNEDPMDFSFFRFYEFGLKHITGDWFAGLGYMLDNHWNIADKGNLNGTVTDYHTYGTADHTISSGISLNVLHDSRDNSINPSKGWYGGVIYRDNLTALGSTTGWTSIQIDLRKYYKFPANSDNVLAFWSYDWLVLNGHPPYLDLPSTSWDTNSATGRGYIQGRFRGAQMLYLESEYRYKITRNGLLGGVVFVNAESLSAAPGTKLQSVQPAFGPGLRVKLNKVSKTNVAIDYGFGRQGSNGLFIDVSEVF